MALVELAERLRGEALALEEGPGLDAVVVDADLLVGVSDGDVEREVVAELVVLGEVEGGEAGVVDVEPEAVGAEDEPEDEDGEADGDDDGHDDLEYAAEDAPAAAAAKVDASAAPRAVVRRAALVRRRGRDRGAVEGPVQVRFLRHDGREGEKIEIR